MLLQYAVFLRCLWYGPTPQDQVICVDPFPQPKSFILCLFFDNPPARRKPLETGVYGPIPPDQFFIPRRFLTIPRHGEGPWRQNIAKHLAP